MIRLRQSHLVKHLSVARSPPGSASPQEHGKAQRFGAVKFDVSKRDLRDSSCLPLSRWPGWSGSIAEMLWQLGLDSQAPLTAELLRRGRTAPPAISRFESGVKGSASTTCEIAPHFPFKVSLLDSMSSAILIEFGSPRPFSFVMTLS